MPTLPEVRSWNPASLSDAADRLTAADTAFTTETGRVSAKLVDLHHDWTGAAFDAARYRVATECAAAARVSTEVTELARALTDGSRRLHSVREVALAKVAAAESDGCRVGDDWSVSAGSGSTERDAVDAHRWAIGRAVDDLVREDGEVTRLVEDAAQQVRARGDQVGDGADLSRPAEEGAARLGREDGEALAAAAAHGDDAALSRIAEQLPAQVLTPSELTSLAAGDEVSTVPQSVRDYYTELYRAAGKDGVLALGDHLKAQEVAGNPGAGRALNSVANGLMLVSNEKVSSGRNPDGSLRSPGSYANLPANLRELVSTRTNGPDKNATTYPGTGQLADQTRFFEDTRRFGALAKEAEPGYLPGVELSREMTRQAASLGIPGGVSAFTGHPGFTVGTESVEQSMRDYLEVSGRNHEATTQLLTGHGSPDQPLDGGYSPVKTIAPLLRYDWSEDQGAPALFDWIGEHATPGPEVSVAQSEQAGSAATGLIRLITEGGVDGQIGTFESLMNLPDSDDRSLGSLNPALTQQVAGAVTPYLDAIAIAPDSEVTTHGFSRAEALGPNADIGAIRLATLMNTDPTASAAFNGAIVDRTNDYAGRFGELHGETSWDRNALGQASGRLLGYMEQGLRAEAYDGGLDDAAAEAKAAGSTKLAVEVATKIGVGVGGPLATPLDVASSFVQQGIEPEYAPLHKEAFAVDADGLAAQRAYRMLAAVTAKEPGLLESAFGGESHSWLQDGRLRAFDEIMTLDNRASQGSKLQSAAEELLDRAGLRFERFNDALDTSRGDLSGYTTDADHYRSRILRGER
ncbi:hypothetical protein FK531_20340 [Rhodococcus spelaei]|uniref:TPR repeat domain-containing protein n=1 Tax=Rhodococcus spelaei TaxID=2546320 RepID=A0A541B0D3_9NOCA|nr:hypothetical protein [Rhodococcus spelaei]TQF65781.1 hypothetical protein FK531_20340 [Rhodococcus spelaei]